jgi:hypothetical protein
MNETLQAWIDACVGTPGTLGGGIRLPDGSMVSRSADENFPPERIERVLAHLAEFQPQLPAAIPAPLASTWLFEQGRIRCVVRPDGCLLALAVRSESEALGKLDQLTEAFLALE